MEGESELQLTEAQEDHLRNCFNDFDRDESGKLDAGEFGEVMQVLGLNPSKDDVEEMIARCRGDDDRTTLDYGEFRSLMIPVIEHGMREMRKGFEEAFREFDKDGSGKLDKEEFKEAVTNKGKHKMTEEEVEDLFQAVDIDDDGKIDCNEMINLFCAVFEAWTDQQEGQQGSQHGSRPGSQQQE